MRGMALQHATVARRDFCCTRSRSESGCISVSSPRCSGCRIPLCCSANSRDLAPDRYSDRMSNHYAALAMNGAGPLSAVEHPHSHGVRVLIHPTLNVFLDLSRSIAAFIVFFGHLRNPLFLGYGSVRWRPQHLYIQIWYFVTGLHSRSRDSIFSCSAVFWSGISIARAGAGRFDLNSYAIDRCTRLSCLHPGSTADGDSRFRRGVVVPDLGFYDHTHPMLREKVASAAFSTLLTQTFSS